MPCADLDLQDVGQADAREDLVARKRGAQQQEHDRLGLRQEARAQKVQARHFGGRQQAGRLALGPLRHRHRGIAAHRQRRAGCAIAAHQPDDDHDRQHGDRNAE